MLNIGKLVAGQQEYYLGVARGVDEYYLGNGEAPGVWVGSDAKALGLSGLVEDDALRRVLSLKHPQTGQHLNRATMPGYDLTFRAPKSVSLLYALGEAGTVSGEVVAAHDAAVAQALAYLERNACAIRYRIDGEPTAVKAKGFTAAAFRHRTSRAGDPTLHSHVLVVNAARAEGRWGALDGTKIFHHARTAGFIYQAALRGELTRRLGVSWESVREGVADVHGIPRGLIEVFSKRRADILEELEELGFSDSSAKASQVAALATRAAKEYPVDAHALRESWFEQAEAFGFGPAEVAHLLERAIAREPGLPDIDDLFEKMVGPEGLTLRRSSFDHRAVVRAVCEALPEGGDVATVLALADEFLAESQVIPLDRGRDRDLVRRADGWVIPFDEARYSTEDMLSTEAQLLVRAVALAQTPAGLVSHRAVEVAIQRRPTLSGEQRTLVEELCLAGHGVELVVGKAGSGKTFGLGAAREAWQDSGYEVIGTALSARAAAELEAGSGIRSTTLARLASRRLQEHGLPDRCVVVIDEAGMVGTRQLAGLLAAIERARGKLVLVGDHRQLPEIEAGGAFAGLARRLGAITLTENRRQTDEWEREALDHLREDGLWLGVDAYRRHGRINFGDNPREAKERLLDDWWAAREAGERVAMVAVRHDDVRDINRRARIRLRRAGELSGARLQIGAFEVAVGDEIIARRNDYRRGVLNGDRGHVVSIDRKHRSIVFTAERTGGALTLPARYLEQGHVDHAYAITIHKAQGATYDRCLLYGDEAIYRQAAYTALSRGRAGNAVYAARDETDPIDGHASEPQNEPDAAEWSGTLELLSRLRADRSQHLAIDSMPKTRRERTAQMRQRLLDLERGRDVGRDLGLSL